MISNLVLDKIEYNKVLNYISNYAITDLAKFKIISQKPFEKKEQAALKGKLVSEAKEILINFEYPPINYLPNLQKTLIQSRVNGIVLNQEEILKVFELSQISRRIFSFFKLNAANTELFSIYSNSFFVDKNFESLFSKIFNEKGEIRDSASAKLSDIRKEIIKKKSSLGNVIDKILKNLSDSYLVQEEYFTQRDGRLVIPIKAEHKRHVKGFIHSESNTGQTVYIEPEQTLELNNDILSLTFAEKREIERILRELTIIIGKNSEILMLAFETITELDDIFANAKYSLEIIGAFPQINDNRKIKIIEGRHPILLKKIGREKSIPLNFNFDKNNVTIITGPNAGGKTVVLKTIGLLSLLVQSGIHIPVQPDSEFMFFSNIMIDIGDEQSLEDDLSTFSSHLKNIKDILENADENSLILIDEIGTGTDPSEGAALATAFLLKISEINSIVITTTHHGNLKIIASEYEKFQNASMEFDIENLIPTYKFRQGIPGSSYAFEVASKIGLNKFIIDSAKQHLDTNKFKVEKFISELETKSVELNKKLNQMEIENSRLQGLTNLYEKENKKLKEQKDKIIGETKRKAEEFLVDLNSKFENTIKNIRETKADKNTIKEEKQKIEEIKKQIEVNYQVPKDENIQKDSFEINDYVKIKDSGTSGEIVEIDKAKDIFTIDTGKFKIKVKINNLVHAKKNNQAETYYGNKYSNGDFVSSRIDIRGRKPEEIEFELIKFIDSAALSNLKNIEIIHGKGTGVLRETVHTILKNHEMVASFEFANADFGGAGATLVKLK
ncbi:MAG: endonuclease MutS2 [Ignavibacteriales bacterium]|nr:endonuclease MutS2 [Ignavibacteriales bacterium]